MNSYLKSSVADPDPHGSAHSVRPLNPEAARNVDSDPASFRPLDPDPARKVDPDPATKKIGAERFNLLESVKFNKYIFMCYLF
jgi:hypothetical protein